MSRRGQLPFCVLVPAILLALLTACGQSSPPSSSAGAAGPAGRPGAAGTSGTAGSPGRPGAPGSPGMPGSASVAMVSCSGNSCSVTLGGEGSRARVLDTRISLQHIRDGQATLRVADESVSCREGHRVSAGGLQLRCTAVTGDTVEFTVRPE